jgi:chromosome segregation ATPase
MKDMSVEELIDTIAYTETSVSKLHKARAELLRRFEVLEKELKATKLAHAVEKQMMQDNFTQCKTAAEHWKKKCEKLEKYNHKLLNEDIRVNNELNAARKRARDLECCGNCGKHYKDCQNELSYGYCPRWTTDGMTRGEREK